jgi:hypothetical protein
VRCTLWLAVALAACGGPAPGSEPVVALSFERFASEVQPMLEASCANPSCHGRPERALRIYAPLRYRADASRTHLAEPLTDEEVWKNFAIACALATGGASADDTLLVRKPLGELAETYHGGGTVFEGSADARHRTLRGWVAEGFEP